MVTLAPSISITLPERIRIGTRRSPLAIAQASEVKARLLEAFPDLQESQVELVKIQTTGDRMKRQPLAEIGGKGLFTKEIEEALLERAIDIAVHSMKDMPDRLPEGLQIACVLEREDPRDAFLSPKAERVEALPEGAVVATSSLRRQSQLLALRPDLRMVPFRGNVHTRLARLQTGEMDATLLAVAGLKRLQQSQAITAIFPTDQMLPAVAQGAIGVECLMGHAPFDALLQHINHVDSWACVQLERAFLATLAGSCSTPIAGLATLKAGHLHFQGLVASPDGKELHRVAIHGPKEEACALGRDAGTQMLALARHLL